MLVARCPHLYRGKQVCFFNTHVLNSFCDIRTIPRPRTLYRFFHWWFLPILWMCVVTYRKTLYNTFDYIVLDVFHTVSVPEVSLSQERELTWKGHHRWTVDRYSDTANTTVFECPRLSFTLHRVRNSTAVCECSRLFSSLHRLQNSLANNWVRGDLITNLWQAPPPPHGIMCFLYSDGA